MPRARADRLHEIDIGPLLSGPESGDAWAETIRAIEQACSTLGFFYVVGHGVDLALCERLEEASRRFFELDAASKLAIEMKNGGRAWRGFFPVGSELTSGRPDQKEGLYFGEELGPHDPRVQAGWPLHGANLFPAEVPGLRPAVLEYLDAMTTVCHGLLRGLAASLDLPTGYFRDQLTADPLILFRIFHYPPLEPDAGIRGDWSVGEHTDYGLITLLAQDECGGLQVKTAAEWVDVPPLPGSFVCNLGDMLDRMTGGRFRSTPHRVRNTSGRSRLSYPFFFDPGFEARVSPIDPNGTFAEDRDSRWDRESVHAFDGTYGEYLLNKVSRVFPQLERAALASEDPWRP
jgi:isopenicillin N synthase-like dioxygenase